MYKQLLILILSLVSLTLKAQHPTDTAQVHEQKLWGYINLYDESKNIPAVYQATGGFSEGLAPVSNGNHWGYIDADNNLVIPYQFEYAKSFRQQQAIVQKGEFYGVINTEGEFVIAPRYYDLLSFQLGPNQYYISRDSTFFQGLIDTSGREVLKHMYSYILPFTGNLSDDIIYQNILLQATYPTIDPQKGSFYTQFSQNAFQFSPEKGRIDIYDAQFNKLVSRHSNKYEDSFQHQELTMIDSYLEENKGLSTAKKKKGIHDLLARSNKLDDNPLSPDTLKWEDHSNYTEETTRYLERLGITLFTDDNGKMGLQRQQSVILPATHHSLRFITIPLLHPLQQDTAYLQQHFAGAFRSAQQDLLDIYCVLADQGDKAAIYSLSGKVILRLTRAERTLVGSSNIGFKYRQVNHGIEKIGLVNWVGEELLPAGYDDLTISPHNHVLTKEVIKESGTTVVRASLFSATGEVLVPAGLYAEIWPFYSVENTYLARANQLLNKNTKQSNNQFEILRAEKSGFTLIGKVEALDISTWSLAEESGMLPYQQIQNTSTGPK